MPELKSKRNFFRIRTAYSVTRTVPPIVSKHLIDMRTDAEETPRKKTKTLWQRKSFITAGTVLDRIISKLKKDYKAQDILLMITPASRHANLYKLHVIQRHDQQHLGMITITQGELSRLKTSKAFQKYCIVFGSRYMNLLQTETITSLINCLNRNCCGLSKETLPLYQDSPTLSASKSNASSAGDYLKDDNGHDVQTTVKLQDSFIQTDPENTFNVTFSLNDIYTLIEAINQTLQSSKSNIERFFFMADKLNFSLVVRPDFLWKTSAVLAQDPGHFLLESYLPDNCYLGCITLLENDLLQALDLYPKLLFNIHVIEDVFEITPLPKRLVNILRRVFGVLKLELLYDAVGELFFDWYKNFTYL